MPFVPLEGVKYQQRSHVENMAKARQAQEKFKYEYEHPILGKYPKTGNEDPESIGTQENSGQVPMSEVYDKFVHAQGFKHNAITGDPNYINQLNTYRSSPNSQLQPIPESIQFFRNRWSPASYNPQWKTVQAMPMGTEAIEALRQRWSDRIMSPGNRNGLWDYAANYNYFDQNDYNKLQTGIAAHEAIGHAGNFPKPYSDFYKPIAERESKSPFEISRSFSKKFEPTYWGGVNGEAEFIQSLHAAKRQGREWGYPVDSDNNEEVTSAFRNTINRIQKMPIDQARQLPLESQRLRAYLNSARQYNSYKEDPNSDWFMRFINKQRKQYNDHKSFYDAEDQNNPQLMDQITEDVLYYTTPETLKGLLARKNNTQLNNYV